MRRSRILSLLGTVALCFGGPAGAVVPDRVPVAPAHPVTDDYFGTRITDPYRWMEGEPKPQFPDYLHAENDYARAVLARIPGRDALAREEGAVSGLAARVRAVQLAGGRSFYLKREAGAQIDRLVMADAAGHETVLVDPSSLGSGGRHAEIDQFAPSMDGSLVAYGVSVGGSENSTLHVIETGTRTIRPDTIDRAQFAGVSWAPDGRSFFFARLPASSANAAPDQQYAHMQVYRHVLGQDPSGDASVLDSDHLPFPFHAAAVFPSIAVTEGSDYALASISDGVSPEMTLYAAPLSGVLAGHAEWRQVAAQSDGVVGMAVRGDRIDLMTHGGAPHLKAVETSLAAPDLAHAAVVVPEGEGVLTGIAAAKDGLYYATRDGAVFSLHRLGEGAMRAETIALPFAGTIAPDEDGSGGLVTDPVRPGALVGLESWVRPHVWLRYDPAARTLADTGILPGFPRDLSGYESVETFATAPDGTRIPLSIVTRKGLPRDGHRPTYLVGYGAYGISYDPAFSPGFLPWLDRGGVYAVAHVRGGGEGGQAWHDARQDRHQAEHDPRLHRRRRGADRQGLYRQGASGRGGHQRRRDPDRRRRHAAPGPVPRRPDPGRRHQHHTRGVHRRRTRQHPGVRHRQGPGAVPVHAGDGRVQPRPPRRRLSRGAADRRRRRPARDGVDPGQDDREAPGRYREPPPGAVPGRVRRRPRHRLHPQAARRRDRGRVRLPAVAVRREGVPAGQVILATLDGAARTGG